MLSHTFSDSEKREEILSIYTTFSPLKRLENSYGKVIAGKACPTSTSGTN